MRIIKKNNINIAILENNEKIETEQDALDIMATAQYLGAADRLVISKNNLSEKFFDLSTKLAGNLLQKFSNYRFKIAIIGDFSIYKSKALQDFIYECNDGNQVFFMKTEENAIRQLIK